MACYSINIIQVCSFQSRVRMLLTRRFKFIAKACTRQNSIGVTLNGYSETTSVFMKWIQQSGDPQFRRGNSQLHRVKGLLS